MERRENKEKNLDEEQMKRKKRELYKNIRKKSE